MENPHVENIKSTVGAFVRIAIGIIGILLFLLFGTMIQKCANENMKTYQSVNEIIEENYRGVDTKILRDGNFYYLLMGNEQELIHFKDGKYFVFDEIKNNFGNTGSGNASDASEEIGITFIDVYSYENDIIITAKRYADDESVTISDNYGRWQTALVNDEYHFMAVRSKAQFTDDYQLIASSKDDDYEIGTMLKYSVKRLD